MRRALPLVLLAVSCAYENCGPEGVGRDDENGGTGSDAGGGDGTDAGTPDGTDAGTPDDHHDAGPDGHDAGVPVDSALRTACHLAGWECGTGTLTVAGIQQNGADCGGCGGGHSCEAHRCRCTD